MKFGVFDGFLRGHFGAWAFWGGHKSTTLNYDDWQACACRQLPKFHVFTVWNFGSITFNHLKLFKGNFLHFMAIWSLSFVKRSKMAEMDHLAHPKKSGIFETFGQNFPIQSMEEGSTLHFLSKSAKNKIFARTPPYRLKWGLTMGENRRKITQNLSVLITFPQFIHFSLKLAKV